MNTIIVADLKQVSKHPKPTFIQYRPPEDYSWLDDDLDRYAFECSYGHTPYVRDLASEGCYYDMEQGRDEYV